MRSKSTLVLEQLGPEELYIPTEGREALLWYLERPIHWLSMLPKAFSETEDEFYFHLVSLMFARLR
jgi:hypothetical protein